MEKWYALVKDASGAEQRLGPMSFAELVHLHETGRLPPGGLVWQPDYPAWRTAAEVEGLAPSTPKRRATQPRDWPSDALPLWILAGIVACFVLHFSQRRFDHAAQPQVAARPGLPAAVVEVEICNRTDVPKVYTTVAYYDSLRHDWVARGWYPVASGTCTLPLKNLKPPVFVYAETKDGKRQFGDAEDGVRFCIDGDLGFILPQKSCSGRRAAFRELKAAGSGDRLTWEVAP